MLPRQAHGGEFADLIVRPHVIKNAMILFILFIFKSIQLGCNMRSEFAKHDLIADLCYDVKCIKFYIRYFKKIIQEMDLLITQLIKKVRAHSITTGLHTNHITDNCAIKKLGNLKLND